jgi:predicted DNA-binding protein with PD1-like motif
MQLRQIGSQPDYLVIVERGEELPRVLVDTCLQQGITNAMVAGSGRAQWIALEGGPAGKRKVAGPLEVLQIHGLLEHQGAKRLAAELRVVASRDMDTGIEVVGGVMIDGVFDSAAIRVFKHQPLGAAESRSASWSTVAEASAGLGDPVEAADEDSPPPGVGDVVEHPKFGPCVVKRLDDEHIHIRLEGGRTVALNLSHLSFVAKGELSTGKRVYAALVRRER